jgi:hypothetical protein
MSLGHFFPIFSPFFQIVGNKIFRSSQFADDGENRKQWTLSLVLRKNQLNIMLYLETLARKEKLESFVLLLE